MRIGEPHQKIIGGDHDWWYVPDKPWYTPNPLFPKTHLKKIAFHENRRDSQWEWYYEMRRGDY